MSVPSKKELDTIIFAIAFHNHNFGTVIENQLKKQIKTLTHIEPIYPSLIKGAVFNVVKITSEQWANKFPKFSSYFRAIVERCNEQIQRLANQLYYSSENDVLTSLVKLGSLGPVKDMWKYINWHPIFTAHQHFRQWHYLLGKPQGAKVLAMLRKTKFKKSIIEKIVWDASFIPDLLQAVNKMSRKEIEQLINKILSIKFLNKQMVWTFILAGNILLNISEDLRNTSTIKKVAAGLFEHKDLHSCSKILVQFSGIKKEYQPLDLYDKLCLREEELALSDEFLEEIYRPKFWKTIFGIKGCKKDEVPARVVRVYENAAEPSLDLDENKPYINFHSGDHELLLLSYKEYSAKTLKKNLESLTNIYLDWHNSPASQRQALDDIITLCNNYKDATTMPVTFANKQKPLIRWINTFIEAPPIPPHPHEKTNEELIADTTQELELLQRLDKYERYYNEVFKEYS